MTPEAFGRVRKIYEQAVLLSGAAREAYLAFQCQDDPGLRQDIERLIAAQQKIPRWLNWPTVPVARPYVLPELPDMKGRRLSGYTLIRELGRGGMGSVYLAERSDDMFHRFAAIKLVLPPSNSEVVIVRFQQEREVLASLDHPNIAKLLDAGVTEEGWPYLIMEFVDGQPIHQWCDERTLNISQRIELFNSVIAAVSYAHQRLVVHRDLKPGNIFVTKDGTVKLLDFGIAKVLSGAVDDDTADTITIALMLTPAYASPEQVNGSAITTLSDIYSMGVVLYELLTGHRPYRLLSSAMHEMARVISEVEPARPSEIVSTSEPSANRGRPPLTPEAVSAARKGDPAGLRKRLAGDLDSILLMALQKKPERRYSSAESFADDLQRHLHQRPIAARETTPWERFLRFRRRNPAVFAMAIINALLFLSALGAVAWQGSQDIRAAQFTTPAARLFLPYWLFSFGIAMASLCGAVYFSRAGRAQRIGAGVGGLVWGGAVMGKWKLEQHLGWWHSRIEGYPDPLMVFSPLTFIVFAIMSAALLLVLFMIGRRFGWKAQLLSVVVLALYETANKRVFLGDFIPALAFQPGPLPWLGASALFLAATLMGAMAMRLIGGPSNPPAKSTTPAV
jgi:serine/threonine protein kinase